MCFCVKTRKRTFYSSVICGVITTVVYYCPVCWCRRQIIESETKRSMFSHCCGVTVTVGYNEPVAEGSEARLTCDHTTSGAAPPTFQWDEIVNGSPVLISTYQNGFGSVESAFTDRFSVEGDSTLVITNNSRSDNGRIYRCEVTVVDDPTPKATDELTLSVAFFGTMMFDIITSPVTEGESVMFVCSANANPDPVIILYKDATEEIIRETTTNLTYSIASVSENDGGNYKCEASNIAGSDTSQVKLLDVQYKPKYDLKEEDTVDPNELYDIELEVSANPSDVIYQWTTDPPGIEDIDSNPASFTVNVTHVNVIVFTITANVTNTIGSTIKSITLTVSVSPCADEPCENGGTCSVVEGGYNCECTDHFDGLNCTICSSSTGLTIGMFFVGIIVGAFGVIAGMMGYTRIIQKTKIDKRSTDKRKQDTYMDYTADRSTASNENQTYQDLQHREEETAYVNVKQAKR